jgi:hypothetical protein
MFDRFRQQAGSYKGAVDQSAFVLTGIPSSLASQLLQGDCVNQA